MSSTLATSTLIGPMSVPVPSDSSSLSIRRQRSWPAAAATSPIRRTACAVRSVKTHPSPSRPALSPGTTHSGDTLAPPEENLIHQSDPYRQ